MKTISFALSMLALVGACQPEDHYSLDDRPAAPMDRPTGPMKGPESAPAACVPDKDATIDGTVATLPGDVAWDGCPADVGLEFVEQRKSLWCWAAVTEMVAKVYGKELRQCELAAARSGETVEACCAAGAYSDPSDPCNVSAVTYAMIGMHAGVDYESQPGAPSEAQLVHEMANARPVELSIKNEFGGHALLVGKVAAREEGKPLRFLTYDPFQGTWWKTHEEIVNGLTIRGQAATVNISLYNLRPEGT